MINKYQDFLSENTLSLLDEKINSIFNHKSQTPIFTSNITNWDIGLVQNSTPILRYIITNEDLELFTILKKEIENKIPYYVNGIILHICPKFSYIPWHNDGGHSAALSIYINKEWKPNWGGYFMYMNEDEILAIKPKRNLAVLQKGGLWHSVSTINSDADYRISIQCFLNKEKNLI